MRTGFRRIVAFLMVIVLLITMPGCATIDGEPATLLEGILHMVTGLIQAAALTIGEVVLAGVFMGLDAILSPLEEWLGWGDWWDVEKAGQPVMLWYGSLVDPNGRFGDWSYTEEEESQTGGEEPEIQLPKTGEENLTLWERIKNWWNGLFGCDHVLLYDSDTQEITCKCGDYFVTYYEEMGLDEFKAYVEKESGQKQSEYDRYVMREYCRYVGAYNGIDPEILKYALNLDGMGLDQDKLNRLEGIVGFLAGASEKISNAADVADGLAKGMDIKTDFFKSINTYFSAANIVFSIVNSGIYMADYEKLSQEPGKEREMVHAAIGSLKSATSIIPIAGVAFDEALTVVEGGLEVLLEADEIDAMNNFLYQCAIQIDNSPIDSVPKWFNLDSRDAWDNPDDNNSATKECPSLAELSAALERGDLTAEQIFILSPYIEFRLQYEMGQIFGEDVSILYEND